MRMEFSQTWLMPTRANLPLTLRTAPSIAARQTKNM